MKKEVILAIGIGFVLGLIITFGIWTANRSLKNLPQLTSPSPTATPQPSPGQTSPSPSPSQISLSISSPENESLTDKNSTTVTGSTAPNAAVAILWESGQQIASPDASGKFTVQIPLEGGFNRISVTAYDPEGKSATQTLTVTYTTAKI